MAGEVRPCVFERNALGALKHLEHRTAAVQHNHPAIAFLAIFERNLRHFVVADAADAVQIDQGALHFGKPDIFQFHSPSLLIGCSNRCHRLIYHRVVLVKL